MSEAQGPKSPRSPRPQSMMAQNFSLALDNMFGLGSAAELEQDLEEKEKNVSQQQAELEALEARLRATEERLKASKLGKTPAELEAEEREWNPVPKKAPVLPAMGLRALAEQEKAQSSKQAAVAPKHADEDEESDDSSENDEEDEDSTEETSEDEERGQRRK